MAAASDESSSEDEALQRCREAVWDAPALRRTDEHDEEKQSRRVVVAEHEHDGNELQVTQGFRAHVSKKLTHYLDSYISEMQPEKACAEPSNGGGDDEDEGFRLFSTSVPGQKEEDPVTPMRRRPAPSSSDSDSEMETRLREAAVSIKDLLPSLSQSVTKVKKKLKRAEGEESPVIQRENEVETELKRFGSAPQSNGTHGDCEQEDTPLRVKKKKKKKKQNLNKQETDQVLKSECAGSPPHGDGGHRNSEQGKVKKKKKKRQEASD